MTTASTRAGTAGRAGRSSILPPKAFPPFVLGSAGAGDHAAIHGLLRTVLHRPSLDEFQAQLDEPFYEPSDRIVAKRGRQIVAHALITKREMYFGDSRFAISGLHELVTLPEYRGQGLGSGLLAHAEHQMQADGAVLGLLTTSQPTFFEQRGWTAWPRPHYSLAGARNILSLLRSRIPERKLVIGERQQEQECNIRLVRAVELPALIRLYDDYVSDLIGPLLRSEAMWRWLGSCQEFDRIYVAIDGPDRLELDDEFSKIVGYAVVRGGAIMELICDPEHPNAGERLLDRVCGDAIEHDQEHIQLHAPPHDALHDVTREAGGVAANETHSDQCAPMVKLFDLAGFVERIEAQFIHRMRDAGLGPKCELGIVVEGVKHRLSVNRRRARLSADNVGRSYITCDRATLQQLLLGYWRIEDALAQGVLASSTRVATDLAKKLLPELSIWRPPFDDETI